MEMVIDGEVSAALTSGSSSYEGITSFKSGIISPRGVMFPVSEDISINYSISFVLLLLVLTLTL